MKITAVEAIPLRIPFTVGGKSAAGAWGKGGLQAADSLLVKVTICCELPAEIAKGDA